MKKHFILVYAMAFIFNVLSAQNRVNILSREANQSTTFAIGDIKTALSKKGFQIDEIKSFGSLSVSDINIVIADQSDSESVVRYKNAGGLAFGELSEQGYAIRKTGFKNPTFWVFGGDKAGVMYGGLRLAEMITLDGLENIQDEQDKPFIKRRGLKFNIPLDKRTPSFADNGINADMHIEYVWDINFWTAWLDDIARYRYNFISLWNLHPFPNLVKLKNFPEAAMNDVYNDAGLVKKMTIDEKIAMWHKVIDHANNRCIDITWITWNIFLNYTKEVTNLKESGYDEGTIKYMRESTAELFRTYPGLHGIGITSGERMRELETAEQKEDWMFKTYGMGVLDVLKEQPDRKILFIHRYWWTSFENIKHYFQPLIDQPNITFDMSFKYSRARLYSAPDPIFAKETVLKTLPSDLRSWWNLRNDDILNFRWGNPDFVRASLVNLPPENQTAGYHMGSDRYVWGRETALRNHTEPRQLQTQFNWYSFMLWGRMGYNPNTPNSFYQKVLENKYPDVNCTALFGAWQNASQSFPLANMFHWHDWDYMWHVETCSGYDKSTGLNATQRFYDVLSFINNPTMEGTGLMKISDYTKAVVAGKAPETNTPFTHAALMKQYANKALAELEKIGKSSNNELNSIKEDIRAQAQAGLYYAYKIEAATYHSIYTATNDEKYKTLAIQSMLRSYKAWEVYIQIFRTQYAPGRMSIINRAVDFDEMLQSVQKDVELVGGKHTDKIVPIKEF